MKLLVDGDFSLWSKGFDYDDCLALIMAINNADVKGVSCVGGNVSVKESVQNALKTVSVTSSAPVYEGVEPPGSKYLNFLRSIKRLTDNRNFVLPECKPTGNAIKALKNLSKKVDKAIFIGPLTNLYLSKAKFNELIIMSGSIRFLGNITPFSEFNAYLDPIALNEVLKREVTVVPFNVTVKAIIGRSILNKFTGELAHLNKLKFLVLNDPLTVTYALKPELFKTKKTSLRVITKGLLKGFTYEVKGSNVNLVTGFDKEGFINYFKKTLLNNQEVH